MSSYRAKIAARAYDLWQQRGKPEGSPEIDWRQAEQELSGGDANDPTKPKATLDSLQQVAADVLRTDSDRGPVASDTATTAPDAPIPKRSRTTRNRRVRDNGATRE